MTPATNRERTIRYMWFVALAMTIALVLAAVMATLTTQLRGGSATATQPQREPAPVLYDVPAFELTSHADETVALDDLRGKVWVANFIFTRCPSVCPLVTGRMAELQQQLRSHARWDDIRLVSFSVDPHHDTPAVLRDYGRRFGADPERWLFLTGDRDRIWRLIEEGFRLAVEDAPENPQMPIMHSDRFVLVDRAGRVRGYYDVLDEEPEDRMRLLLDVVDVVNEPSPAAAGGS